MSIIENGTEFPPPPRLRNTYWLLRHGRSLANEAGIMVSKLENGLKPEYTLAPSGRQQAEAAGQQLAKELQGLPPDLASRPLVSVASPFSRTVETATIACAQVGLDPSSPRFRTSGMLVERDFGSANELQSYHGRYEAVWEQDRQNPSYVPGEDGESVLQVAARLRLLFKELEDEFQGGANILLTAHGDTLSIMQAAMAQPDGWDLRDHRHFAFETAELRRLN